ncbi:MAG: prepilin-type N-terminal cleavage/methylation domain-containing protein [bacterium]|nr:prepilin-type N-terminal cleavage/methylation domain-containing protein [bacterium]
MPTVKRISNFHFPISNYGFTLIELLVVISIIGILIALSGVAFQSARQSARDAVRKTDLADIRSALEVYRTDCGTYPGTITFGANLPGAESSCSGNVYHSKLPQDPISASFSYKYTFSSSTYTLCARLETGSGDAGCGSCGDAVCNYKVTSP